MNKTFKYLLAALVLIAAAACTKEIEPEQKADQVVTCSFSTNDAVTKTALDGLAPKWTAGDQIKLYGYKKTGEYTFEEQGSITVTLAAKDIISNGTKCTFAIPGEWDLGVDDYVYAIYPAANAAGITDGGFPYVDKVYFNVPASLDGTFANANICVGRLAMYETTLYMQNVTPILKVSVPAGAFKKLEVYTGASYMPLNGEAWVNNLYGTLGLGWGSTKTPTTTVTINSTATDIYIPVMTSGPLGIGASFTFTRADDTTLVMPVTHNNTLHPGTMYNLGTVLPDAISGVFSVSSTKKVRFSKGNLQATYSAGTSSYSWDFAANQFDTVGGVLEPTETPKTGNNTIRNQTDGAKVDLFGWSTTASNNNWGVHADTTLPDSLPDPDFEEFEGGDFKDWGALMGSNWRTLTANEWVWLIGPQSDIDPGTNCRMSPYIDKTTNARYMMCKIKISESPETYSKGLLIFPDVFYWPTGESAPSETGLSSYINDRNNDYVPTFTVAQFATLEEAGAVFLPAAGGRGGSRCSYVGEVGYYWTSSAVDGIRSNLLFFNYGKVNGNNKNYRNTGYSVRLVTDVN